MRISELRLEDLKTVTFYFWTLQEDHTPDNVTFTYLLEPFSSLLHVWLCRHQLSYCHACRGQTRQFQLVPVRSPRLLDRVFVLRHPLNWKSPHHARKRKEPRTLHDKKLKCDICGFPNWDWKIWKQSLSISEHCKKTTHRTTWPSPIFLNLSRASYMCGCVDINWVTVMRAGGRHVNSNLFQWEVPACLTKFLCWYIP